MTELLKVVVTSMLLGCGLSTLIGTTILKGDSFLIGCVAASGACSSIVGGIGLFSALKEGLAARIEAIEVEEDGE